MNVLPPELVAMVMLRLGLRDVDACRCVNHAWHDAMQHTSVARALYQRHFGPTVAHIWPTGCDEDVTLACASLWMRERAVLRYAHERTLIRLGRSRRHTARPTCLFVGPARSGKSTLATLLAIGSALYDYVPTIGPAFYDARMHVYGHTRQIRIVESRINVATQCPPDLWHTADAAVITSPPSLVHTTLRTWLPALRRTCGSSLPVLLVCTKMPSDKGNDDVDMEEVHRACANAGISSTPYALTDTPTTVFMAILNTLDGDVAQHDVRMVCPCGCHRKAPRVETPAAQSEGASDATSPRNTHVADPTLVREDDSEGEDSVGVPQPMPHVHDPFACDQWTSWSDEDRSASHDSEYG